MNMFASHELLTVFDVARRKEALSLVLAARLLRARLMYAKTARNLKFKVRKLNIRFGPTVLPEAPGGGVTSAIDPDFKSEKIACR